MPSWQNRLLALFIKAKVKRRPINDEAKAVARVRARLENPPKYMRQPIPAGIKVRQVDENGVRGEWLELEKSSNESSTLFYLHGGGYVACSPRTHRPLTSALSLAAGVKTFSVDYRLAPEHRFPTAVEDAVKAYRWLIAGGLNPKQIVIAGDSAGGGLTLATLVALRDAEEPLPAAAICLSPWTDLAATGPSLVTNNRRDVMFYGDGIKRAARVYLGETSPDNPLASPLYADLTGLPPLLIYASNSEVLLDDSVRLAERAKQCGVKVDLQIWDGLPHVWPIFVHFLPEARESVKQMAAFINQQARVGCVASTQR